MTGRNTVADLRRTNRWMNRVLRFGKIAGSPVGIELRFWHLARQRIATSAAIALIVASLSWEEFIIESFSAADGWATKSPAVYGRGLFSRDRLRRSAFEPVEELGLRVGW